MQESRHEVERRDSFTRACACARASGMPGNVAVCHDKPKPSDWLLVARHNACRICAKLPPFSRVVLSY